MRITRRALASVVASGIATLSGRHAFSAVGGRKEVRFFYAGKAAASTRTILESLQARYPTALHSLAREELVARAGPAILVAVGPAALQALVSAELLEGTSSQIVALFVSRPTFHRLVDGRSPRGRTTGIYAETSPGSQFQLIEAIFNRRVSVAALLSDSTAYLETELQRTAARHDVDLTTEVIAKGADVVRTLASMRRSTVLLAVPDPQIYAAETLRGVLESTYRRGQAMVGFGPELVQAGALATTYAALDDVAAQLDALLAIIQADRLPSVDYPHYWRVSFNEQVARSLNIVIPDGARDLARKKGDR